MLLSPVTLLRAEPWLAPGDLALRHDVQMLADAGVLKGPMNAWPLHWSDIARDVARLDDESGLRPHELQALSRLRIRIERETQAHAIGWHARLAAAEKPRQLRTFEATPREDGEIEAGMRWLGDRFAYRLQATVVADPEDDKTVRFDDSYFGAAAGNMIFSVGAMDRWWGPGWEGSLIWSNNARPIPGISIERNQSDPFKPKWLRWMGPWTAQVFFGWLESGRAVPNTQFFALRFGFRPTQRLEIGLSRTAQWCGDGRPCDLDTFIDLLLGKDNAGQNVDPEDEPGNQLAGYDFRYATPWSLSFYSQFIGEDEQDGLPSTFLGLLGIEKWGSGPDWLDSYRVHVEYSDTACRWENSNPNFNCAYNSGVYPDGYRYRGRVIGHAMDGDGTMLSLGGTLVDTAQYSWSFVLRSVELNRDGAPDPRHSITPTSQDLINVEFSHTRRFWGGSLQVGLGYDHLDDEMSGETSDDFRAFAQWQSVP